jgi:2-(1,2-epoxy-1,2-dihydrophenyl)acetyl-CoA isomerase
LACDAGASHFLPRLVGDARARGLLMLGEPVTAEQAAAWGMIWKAVDDDVLGREAAELTGRLADMPTFGLKLLKEALGASPANSLDRQLDLERDYQKLAGLSFDYAEFVRAFFEKRKPNFRGN